MTKLPIPEPFSGGIFLSYKCNSECKHCMYACSPRWKADWIKLQDAEKIMAQLSKAFKKTYPPGFSRVGVNLGLHFTGGEPFLNFSLLLDLVRMAGRLGMPSTFVETNCFWSVDDKTARDKLMQLQEAGLHGMLLSVNPFILEYVPFDRTRRAIRLSEEIFGGNVMVYQEFFRQQFERLGVEGTLKFDEYLRRTGAHSLSYIELIPMGRACYKLWHLFGKHQAEEFFGESCREELTRSWHVHIDNYGNYVAGYCGGISLGDGGNLDSICQGLELEDHPVVARLVSPRGVERLYKFAAEEFRYRKLDGGYVSKCHLCVDIRKRIVERTDEFQELKPREFYQNL